MSDNLLRFMNRNAKNEAPVEKITSEHEVETAEVPVNEYENTPPN